MKNSVYHIFHPVQSSGIFQNQAWSGCCSTLEPLAIATAIGPCWTWLIGRSYMKTSFFYGFQLHSWSVCHCQLVSNVLKHLSNTLSCLARCLVDSWHQIVALLTKSLHVWVGDLYPTFLIKFVAASTTSFILTTWYIFNLQEYLCIFSICYDIKKMLRQNVKSVRIVKRKY